MKKRICITTGVAMLLGLAPILTTGATVYANEESNYVQVNSTTKELEKRMEALSNQYKGVSLFETEFNKENMTPVQLELYNKVLDLQYDIALQNGSTNGMSREQYKQYLSNAMQGLMIQPRNAGHGLISVDFLGTALDTIINVGLIISGFGSVATMVKTLGKEGAKKFVKKELIPQVIKETEKLGIKGAKDYLKDEVVGIIVTSLLSPGSIIAKALDSHDKIPNNGYIELT
ncbi:hypothetical protein [Enterococcus faecalis]|uniref:hypothetical protein n=1 Tax=Enterococcus faecalis TaxID=1351 RepID=UPI001E3BF2FE|nr:hypothetical protein [Enterococcus faecalis]